MDKHLVHFNISKGFYHHVTSPKNEQKMVCKIDPNCTSWLILYLFLRKVSLRKMPFEIISALSEGQ